MKLSTALALTLLVAIASASLWEQLRELQDANDEDQCNFCFKVCEKLSTSEEEQDKCGQTCIKKPFCARVTQKEQSKRAYRRACATCLGSCQDVPTAEKIPCMNECSATTTCDTNPNRTDEQKKCDACFIGCSSLPAEKVPECAKQCKKQEYCIELY
jgi:hypothetical protein